MSEVYENDDSILARLSLEFVDAARDQLDDIDAKIEQFEKGEAEANDALLFIQREVHNIKGQGATFGFPLTGRIAHMLEDFLINANGIRENNLIHIRFYLDHMANLLSLGKSEDETETQELLNSLPIGHEISLSTQKIHTVNVLLVMPPGTQRKMIALELLSCGFRVMRAYDCNEALSVATDIIPDIVFINYDMAPFSGRELSNVFAAVDKLRDVHIVLLTSLDIGNEKLKNLPPAVSVVHKQQDFMEKIGELMIQWDVFGTSSK